MRCRGCSASAWADGRFAVSGSTTHYAPDRTLVAGHLRLEFELDFKTRSLHGLAVAGMTAVADDVTEVFFDAVGFKDLRVSSARRPVRHEYDGRRIKILWQKPLPRGQRIDFSIRYRVVRPKLGLHFVGPDKDYSNKPVQAWTQGEDEYSRFWFPCHDAPQERMTTETLITVPASFTAVSNGRLAGTSRNRRKKSITWHWKQDVPHSPYLVSFVAGEFSKIEARWRNTPVLYYCVRGREDDALRAFGKTPEMIEFFSKKLGIPYPYAKYSQVAAVDFIYGGMENTSCTTQTAMTLHDKRAHIDFSSDPLVAHELSHQWFGDLVTCRDWSQAWLNESFATYFEALFKEHDLGYDEFMYELRENAHAYFEEDKDRYRRPMVTNTFKNANDLFDRHLYEKGSLILHMIRQQLGDKAWWRSLNLYLKRHKGKNVETIDLIEAFREATGRNLREFFDQWIYKAGHPEYRVRTWWDARQKKQFIRVIQAHATGNETGLFSLPVTFALHTTSGVERRMEKVDKKEHIFSYALREEPEFVLFDPEHTILKKINFVKPEAMWFAQLRRDPHVLGRIDAAEALGKLGSPSAVEALIQALESEKFWGAQTEISRALGRINTSSAMEGLLKALRTIRHPKVRRALYEALGRYSNPQALAALRSGSSREESYFAEGEAIRGMGKMRDAAVLPELKRLLERSSWNDVIRCAALDAIASLRIPESIEILKAHTKRGHSASVRMTAIRALGAIGHGREDIQTLLVRLLGDPYLLIQIAAARQLGIIADERAVTALMKYISGDLDGRLKRTAEEAVRKIRKGMEQELPSARHSRMS